MNGRGGVILIRTQLRTAQGVVTLHVADNGPGIDTADIKNIFDPFFTTKAVGRVRAWVCSRVLRHCEGPHGRNPGGKPAHGKIRSLFPPDAPTETGSLFTWISRWIIASCSDRLSVN